ncbi:MAG: tRNA uridine-5-carboxymethylaminomethyl(34) synthesis enzyme MnmG, partial [Acidobacteria bacterium]|nr:tRNA uridine-5-carboxymethylaminomethyl(34) synthesis enzyme MnmG [Acidobacteriota bacterium]
SPRAQADRGLYRREMRLTLEATPNLHLRQGLVIDLIVNNGQILGVEMQDTRRIRTETVILATGTFLNGLIHTGKRTYAAGRAGEPASTELAECLKQLGFPLGRLKTGTPPRLDGRSIDWDQFSAQPGDSDPVPFSFSTQTIEQRQVNCFSGYTNEGVHQAIRDNLSESPLYSGQIKGLGPRYCPSIEDKVVKFPDKNRHQLFLEPEGLDTTEIYLNGFSTSMPAELQQYLVHKISGLEEARIIRPGYAIEYDFVDPRELTPYLQTKRIKGLFFAGQINGTTGYEEAACQGLLAGINAALQVSKKDAFQLDPSESYIGVLVNDLIKDGVDEPYRMFTSRAENRLSLRYDTADLRLSSYAYELGLVDDATWDSFNSRRNSLAQIRIFLDGMFLKRKDHLYQAFSTLLHSDLGDSISLSQLSKRPELNMHDFLRLITPVLPMKTSSSNLETVYGDLIYHGYIRSQSNNHARINSYDTLIISPKVDFRTIQGLSHEMVCRFEQARPATFGQARQIAGLTPTALVTLLIYLRSKSPSVSRATSVQ